MRSALAPLQPFTFVILLVFIMSPASDFIWDWAFSFEQTLGVDRSFGDDGEKLASPNCPDHSFATRDRGLEIDLDAAEGRGAGRGDVDVQTIDRVRIHHRWDWSTGPGGADLAESPG